MIFLFLKFHKDSCLFVELNLSVKESFHLLSRYQEWKGFWTWNRPAQSLYNSQESKLWFQLFFKLFHFPISWLSAILYWIIYLEAVFFQMSAIFFFSKHLILTAQIKTLSTLQPTAIHYVLIEINWKIYQTSSG